MQNIIMILNLFILCVGCNSPVSNTTTKTPSNNIEEQFINEYSEELDRLYRLDSMITLEGKLKRDKSGTQLNGVYLETAPNTEKIVKIQGKLKRIAYPIAYYSTNESPQGMFSDTTIKHYRLFIEPNNIEIISD